MEKKKNLTEELDEVFSPEKMTCCEKTTLKSKLIAKIKIPHNEPNYMIWKDIKEVPKDIDGVLFYGNNTYWLGSCKKGVIFFEETKRQGTCFVREVPWVKVESFAILKRPSIK